MRISLFLLFLLLCSCVDETYVDYSKVSEKILEVPDPGPENDNTLAGIDSDRDGIRDDVQRWINAKYYKKMNLQNALKQYARDKQNELLNAHDKEKSIKASHKMLDSNNCVGFFVHEYVAKRKMMDALNEIIVNTRSRIKANMDTNHHFHGEVRKAKSSSEKKSKCRFKIIE